MTLGMADTSPLGQGGTSMVPESSSPPGHKAKSPQPPPVGMGYRPAAPYQPQCHPLAPLHLTAGRSMLSHKHTHCSTTTLSTPSMRLGTLGSPSPYTLHPGRVSFLLLPSEEEDGEAKFQDGDVGRH